jgi:uncharacterized protein YceK
VLYATLARTRHPATGRLNSGVRPLAKVNGDDMKRITLLLIILLLIVGCSTSGMAIPLGTKTYPSTSADSIVILAESPTSPFVDVALVDGTAATEEYLRTCLKSC